MQASKDLALHLTIKNLTISLKRTHMQNEDNDKVQDVPVILPEDNESAVPLEYDLTNENAHNEIVDYKEHVGIWDRNAIHRL